MLISGFTYLSELTDFSSFGPERSPATEDGGVSYSRPPVFLSENKRVFLLLA